MNFKKLVPLASLTLCVGLLATSCSKDDPTTEQKPTPEAKTETGNETQNAKPMGTQEASITISLGAKTPTYFSFLKNDVSKLTPELAQNSKHWDIAFLGLNGLSNSGDNGSGKVAVLRTETDNFEGIVNVTPFLDKAYSWISDATISVTSLDRMPPRQISGNFNKLLVEAYSFNMESHPPKAITSKHVYLIRTAMGDYVKMQFLGVTDNYDSYKIRYAYLGTTGENKLTPKETTPSTQPTTPEKPAQPNTPSTTPTTPKVAGEARVALATAGSLETALKGEDLSKLTKLIVTSGTLNQKDLDYISKSLKISEIDLSSASLSLQKDDNGFYGNSSLKKITAPTSLERTEAKWFSNTSATSIVFPGQRLKYFGGATYNEYLKSIVLPNSVVELGEEAFAHSNYESITLSNALKVIPVKTFTSCRRLTKLVIPASVTEIRDHAFSNCSKLKEITFLCPAPKFTPNMDDENAFEEYDYDVDPSFIVPKGTRTSYLEALGWSPKSPVAQRFVEAK